MTNELIAFFFGAFAGSALAWFIARTRTATADPAHAVNITRLETELVSRNARVTEWEQVHKAALADAAALREQLARNGNDLATLRATLDSERRQAEEKLALLMQAREEMSNQFRALASELLEEKSTKFVEVNQLALTQLLAPFQGELAGFRKKVEEVSLTDSNDRAALKEQLRALTELNGTLRDETTNLTKALKGDSKVQGDWGEMILDQLLDGVGFVEGTHYTRQGSHSDDDGKRVIPDVVIHLPASRHIVVDSKVSLTAYADLVAAPDDDARTAALAEHMASVRAHIKELSAKNYQDLYALESLDVVVMFVPNDGAFIQALAGDQKIQEYAWERNVLIVSPSTLLFVVRVIAQLWRQAAQSKNWQDIADRGAKLYDKFVNFAEDLLEVGTCLDKAKESYNAASAKLSTGAGNLIGQADKLLKLGVKGKKAIPKELVVEPDEDAGEPEVRGVLS